MQARDRVQQRIGRSALRAWQRSGSAAGDEVITTPITDMGALTPIFYEGAVPVFADVDPDTLNVTAEQHRAPSTPSARAPSS